MEQRPDPDELLAKVQREEAKQRRGKLKVFFGAAAGVGKTYAMLSEAREKRAEGCDVVVGIVETHGMPAAKTGSRAGAPETVSNGGGNRVPVGNRQQLKFAGFVFVPISPTCLTCRKRSRCARWAAPAST